ncbi:hypothetical protein FRC06_008766 [Ceratobasidium sp. 370]|nr:hypothetical protein FRC06_008766 [Ceratobasidium sp. 370]
MGDRWDGDNLMRSTYVWLPLEISGTTASMPNNYASWVLDIDSNSMPAAPSEKWYEAENGVMSGAARPVSCWRCSRGSAVGWIGGTGNGSLTLDNITSDSDVRTTIRIQAPNGDFNPRNTVVTINGVSQVIPFLHSNSGNDPGTVALNVDLKRGNNTITFSGYGGEDGADIDAIVVSE